MPAVGFATARRAVAGSVLISMSVVPCVVGAAPALQKPPRTSSAIGGFVLVVDGRWQVQPGNGTAMPGMALPPGAVLQAIYGSTPHPEIVVALPFGKQISSCTLSVGGDRQCVDRLELPRRTVADSPVVDRISLAIKRLVATGAQHLVTTIARGVLTQTVLRSAPLRVDGVAVDLSGLFVEFRTGDFDFVFSSVSDGARVFRCRVRSRQDLQCRPSWVSGADQPLNGLYRVSEDSEGWTGGALLVAGPAFARVDRDFRQTLDATSQWDAASVALRGIREVLLEVLSDELLGVRPAR